MLVRRWPRHLERGRRCGLDCSRATPPRRRCLFDGSLRRVHGIWRCGACAPRPRPATSAALMTAAPAASSASRSAASRSVGVVFSISPADLGHTVGDGVGIARALDDGGLVLGDDDLGGGAEQPRRRRSPSDRLTSLMTPPPVRWRCRPAWLWRSPKPGALTATDSEGASSLLDDQGRGGFALDVPRR